MIDCSEAKNIKKSTRFKELLCGDTFFFLQDANFWGENSIYLTTDEGFFVELNNGTIYNAEKEDIWELLVKKVNCKLTIE